MKTLKGDLVYPELSYKIVGIAFDVQNEIGGGLREKTYEQAMSKAFENAGILFKRQINQPVKYRGEKVGDRFLDFLVEERVVVELKAGERFSNIYIKQISEYLKSTGLKLGILINFGKEDVKFKRVVNIINS